VPTDASKELFCRAIALTKNLRFGLIFGRVAAGSGHVSVAPAPTEARHAMRGIFALKLFCLKKANRISQISRVSEALR
jgi:hypothetical protein